MRAKILDSFDRSRLTVDSLDWKAFRTIPKQLSNRDSQGNIDRTDAVAADGDFTFTFKSKDNFGFGADTDNVDPDVLRKGLRLTSSCSRSVTKCISQFFLVLRQYWSTLYPHATGPMRLHAP